MKSEKELFKISRKSICAKCENIDEICNSRVSISCGTDSNIGLAFVQSCNFFNKRIIKKKYESKTILVSNTTDSRIEMMGGGFKEI